MGRKAAHLTYDRRPKLERTRSDFAGHTFRQYHHDEMVVIIDVICGGIARQTGSFTGNRSWPASPSDIDPGPPETSLGGALRLQDRSWLHARVIVDMENDLDVGCRET
jgi:hypothetical protein